MNFDQFLHACGGSFFPEEYRGDLDAAWQELQRSRPDHSADVEVKAEYLRCFAIHSIITGNVAEAYQALDNLHALLNSLPAKWGLRYTICMLLADYTHNYPPTLRFCQPMLSDMSGPHEMKFRFINGVQAYFDAGSTHDKGLYEILSAIAGFPMLAGMLHFKLFQVLFLNSLPHHISGDLNDVIMQRLERLVSHLIKAEQLGETRIATYLLRLLVEVSIATQWPGWMTWLNGLYKTYDDQEDYAGMANCQMMKGDGLLGPSFTNPLALNLVLTDASSATGEDGLWDPVESDLKDQYSSQVKECYEAALELFRRANCKRGQAAVLLRQACCLHIKARRLKPTDSTRSTLLHDARTKLHLSNQFFGKDEVNRQIATAHQILLDITSGGNWNVKSTARGIGTWALQANNQSAGHCLGLLVSRFAHQEWRTFARMDTAIVAWECAYEISDSIGDIIPMFQSIVSRASVHSEMSNLAALKIMVDKAIGMVDQVCAYYDTVAEITPDTNTRIGIQTSKFDMLSTFNTSISDMYVRLGDPQLAHEWQSKFVGINKKDEIFRKGKEGLQGAPDCLSFLSPLYSSTESLKDFWQRRAAEGAMMNKARHAKLEFQEWIGKGDIGEAEAVCRRFMDETETVQSSVTRDCSRLAFYGGVGDQTSARIILDTMDDNALFRGNLEDYRRGIGIKLTFPCDADIALSFCLLSQDEERAYRVVQIVQQIAPTFYDTMDRSAIDYSFRLSFYGATMLSNGHFEVAFRRLLEARQLIELRRQQTTDVDARAGTFSPWMGEVYFNLSRACLKCADARVPLLVLRKYSHGHPDDVSWEEHALLFLEESRARVVLEALKMQFSCDQDEHSSSALLSELIHVHRLLRALLALKHPTPEQEKEISELQSRLSNMEASEASSTASSFIHMANPTVAPRFLYQSIDEDAVVIEATFGNHGSIVSAITSNGIQKIYQDCTRSIDIRKPVMQMMKVMTEMTGYLGNEEEHRKKMFKEFSQQISALLVEPFKETIKQKKHIIFSTSDPLTAFPFSALILEGQFLMTRFGVSQVPSLTVMHHLSQREVQSAAPTVSVFARSPPAETFSAMADKQQANLHLSGIEAVTIAKTFSTWPVDATNVKRAEFCKYVEGNSSILHIGTHGDIDYRNPLLSSISIGEDFRVLDMATMKINANLLVFAACLSGLGRATTGSEVLGFSHVVLGSGCQAYIGTLSKVSDFASMLLMTLFYRTLKKAPWMPLAYIFRQAQIEIGQFDVEHAARYLDQLIQTSPSSNGDSRGPEDFVPDAEFTILAKKMILDQLDWSSPFFWAPFVLMGHGNFRFETQ
ncbi:hypothetical protein IFM53868_08447 [Aspergillus udagawae]|uniref:CHAT domain-containing protein n=1 Tax=Aspergillus udagawae TaxID=91492 RepID=A0ABQ1B8U4_9EURO|nr:hypothetical protein IFM53868_08447 [Aspergillus udagawae]